MNRNKFKKIAKEVISFEIKSLQKLRTSIDKNFNKALTAITNCRKGKIILSGVGKSGIIAKYHLLFHRLELLLFLLMQVRVLMVTWAR